MSVILFFGGLLTSNDRPVPVDNLPTKACCVPSCCRGNLLAFCPKRLLFRHEEMQEVKSPQRLNQPTQHNLLARHHGSGRSTVRVGLAHAHLCQNGFSPPTKRPSSPAGWDGPKSPSPCPLPARLTATRRLPDRPIFPPSRADGRAPLKGSFSHLRPKRAAGSGNDDGEAAPTPPVCPTPRLCASDCLILQTGLQCEQRSRSFSHNKDNTDPYAAGRGRGDASRRMQQGNRFLEFIYETAPERCRMRNTGEVRGYDRGGRPINRMCHLHQQRFRMNALTVVFAALCNLCDRVSFLRPVHCKQGAEPE